MSRFTSFRLHYRLYTAIGIVLLIVVFALTSTFPADAKVAIFDSLFAERQVEVKNDGVTNTIQNLHTHTWRTFSGELPEAVTVNDISLILVWSKTQDENVVDAEVVLPVAPESISNSEESSSGDEVAESASSSGSQLLRGDSEDVQIEEVNSTSTEEVEEEVIVDAEEEQSVEEPSNGLSDTEEIEVLEIERAEPVVEESPVTFLRTNLDRFLALAHIIPLAEAYTEGDEEISSTSEVPVSEVSETIVETTEVPVLPAEVNDEVSGTNNEEVPTEIEATSTPLYPTLESASVQYSFDGDSWTNLGTINLVETNQAFLSLGIDKFSSIDSLLVRVVYLAPTDATPIIFGNAQLELGYTPVLIEDIIPPPSDQEPNFLVSSVKQDIAKEGARAVLLERGGALELWSGVTDVNGEIFTWKRLASGSVLNESTPIDIFNETIFWFDGNGNALLAYDLEKESQIGTAVSSAGDNVFVLMYEDKRQTFLVTYSPETKVFQFEPFSP